MVTFLTEIYGTLHLKTYPNDTGSKPLKISVKMKSSGVVYIFRTMEGTPACFVHTHECFTFGYKQIAVFSILILL